MANFTFSLSDIVPDYMKAPAEPKPSEARLIGEQAIEGPLRETVAALPWAQAATGFAPLFGYPSGYDITSNQALDAARQQLGLSGQEPNTMLGRAAGAAVRTATSPSTYYTSPLFGMPRMGTTAATAIPSAAGAEIGGEMGGLPGAIAGGFLGGSYSLFSPTNLMLNGSSIFSNLKNSAGAGGTLTDLTQAAGNKRAAGVAIKALESDPEINANLLRATEIERLTGVKLPAPAATQGSNVILQESRSQAAADPSGFGAAMRQQELDAKQSILDRAKALFGKASSERLLEATAQPASATKSLTRRLTDIDDELAIIGNRVDSVDPTELGNRITNLVKSKEVMARDSVKPLYETSLNDATEAGIKLNPTQTERLYSFVNDEVNQDIFKTFPSIYSKIKSKFGPEIVKTGAVDDAGKDITQEVFKDATVRDLDSLKRGINEALRGNASQDTRRVLNNLKFELNSVVDELPASFKTSYRGADAEYLRKVGIPFEARAIEEIGSKGFVEKTVPVLTKNPSALNQFLDIAGNEGKDIVRDSFMYDLGNVPNLLMIDAKGNSIVNPKLIDRFLAKNKDSLKIVPEIADEIRGLSTDSKLLLNTQAKLTNLLKTEQKREADNLFSRIGNEKLDTVVGRFLTIPNDRAQVMKELNKNPEALKGFRASVLEGLTTSGRTYDDFLKNKDALDTLFGPTYIKNVEALAEATQSLYSNPLKLNIPLSSIRKTKIEEFTGMPPEQIVSLARRQITSPFQKVTIGLSKFFQNKANQTERAAISDFLLDTDKLKETAALYQKINTVEDTEKIKSLAGKVLQYTTGQVARRGSYGAYLGAIGDFGNEEQQPTTAAPSNEMQFNFAPPPQ
jgi:hypothetical protein